MSARRACGAFRLHVELTEADLAYVVSISRRARNLVRLVVGAPPSLPVAVDAPAAFDSAAHAAMSFAVDAGDLNADDAELGESGWVIRRAR